MGKVAYKHLIKPYNYFAENHSEALLSFEQAIKHNSSHPAVLKSIFEIAKIKIELRDFYSAIYTLNRYDHLDFSTHKLSYLKFKTFTEAVGFNEGVLRGRNGFFYLFSKKAIHLMKRKFKQGIKSLSSLKKEMKLSSFLQPLVLNYRAYGYFCVGDFKVSIENKN